MQNIFLALLKYFLISLLFISSPYAQDSIDEFDQSYNNQKKIVIDNNWKFKAGDNIEWKEISYNDADWLETESGYLPLSGWEGIGWIRIKVNVDSTALNIPYGLIVDMQGAAEIYVDGTLTVKYGKILDEISDDVQHYVYGYQKPVALVFRENINDSTRTSEHLIAIKYSSYTISLPVISFDTEPYFNLLIDDVDTVSSIIRRSIRITSVHQMLLLGIFLSFGIVHLLLFLFYRKMIANLYFTAISIILAVLTYSRFELFFTDQALTYIWYFRVANIAAIILVIASAKLVYFLLYDSTPKMYRVIQVAGVFVALIFFIMPFVGYTLSSVFITLGFIELLRVIILALIKRKKIRYEGSWIVLLGFIPVFLIAGYEVSLDLELSREIFGYVEFPRALYSMLFLIISMSIFLSRNFALTNKNLEAQLEQVKLLSEKTLKQELQHAELEAENKRKSEELEKARDLQLSMLPKNIPVLDNVDIAVYMKTATEVGGDYYDFIVGEDFVLTAVIGDATGHGLQSGSVVTATKTLFKSFGADHQPADILLKSSATLKQMGFDKLMMALTAIKLKKNILTLASAAMPFALLYEFNADKVREIELPGVPLGSMLNFNYPEIEIEFNKGDVILFMSDGFPEMYNDDNKMLGYEKTKKVFEEIAKASADEIITHLVDTGNSWAGSRTLEDDITFLVIKMK